MVKRDGGGMPSQACCCKSRTGFEGCPSEWTTGVVCMCWRDGEEVPTRSRIEEGFDMVASWRGGRLRRRIRNGCVT